MDDCVCLEHQQGLHPVCDTGMPKPGYYAVRKGKKRGLFQTWAECEAQVKGFPGAVFKKFKSQEEAKQYLGTSSTEPAQHQHQHQHSNELLDIERQSFFPTTVRKSPHASHNSRINHRGNIYAVRRGHTTGIFNN